MQRLPALRRSSSSSSRPISAAITWPLWESSTQALGPEHGHEAHRGRIRERRVFAQLRILRSAEHDVVRAHEGDGRPVRQPVDGERLVAEPRLAVLDHAVEGVGAAEEVIDERALRPLIDLGRRAHLLGHGRSQGRLANRVQLTSDGHKAYLDAVEDAFGADVDYAQLVKIYGAAPESFKGRYSPAECIGCEQAPSRGLARPEALSTSFAERQNLTMRMHMRRFTRLTNAFSKKVENHVHSLALFTTYYNFVRVHKTLRMSPAMAAGVSDRLWDIGDIVALVEAAEAQPGKRGPYKARVAA